MVPFEVASVTYYAGCPSEALTPTEFTSFASVFTLETGSFDDIQFETTRQIVGAYDGENAATFTFKPATALPSPSGNIILNTPPWYQGTDDSSKDEYPFGQKGFGC